MLSLFRNDTTKRLWHRMHHLTAKTGITRWIWCTGNNDDDTEAHLRSFANIHPGVTVVRCDSDVLGMTPNERMVRLSEAFNAALDQLTDDDDYILDHESDLESPIDVAERFLASGKDVIGGWPMLGHLFYDTFCYRDLTDRMFTNDQPRPDTLTEMHSVGSCWLAPAHVFRGNEFARGLRCHQMGVFDLMSQMRKRGLTIWFDPSITVVQPVDLWVSSGHATNEVA